MWKAAPVRTPNIIGDAIQVSLRAFYDVNYTDRVRFVRFANA